METKAYNWARSNVFVRTETKRNVTSYYIQPTSNAKKITLAEIKQYDKIHQLLSWQTFDTYVKSQSQHWKVVIEGTDWEHASCTCKSFQKDFICKHVLGIAIRLNVHHVRPEAKNVPIGEKRKRGRPKKCKKALLRE